MTAVTNCFSNSDSSANIDKGVSCQMQSEVSVKVVLNSILQRESRRGNMRPP